MSEELGEVLHREIVEYYQMVKGGNVWEYETEEFLTLLTTRAYIELPFEVSEVIFRCLGYYQYVHRQYKKTRYIVRGEWGVEMWDYSTKERITYHYKTLPELPINQLPDQVYKDFFRFYTLKAVHNYYDNIMPMKLHSIRRGNRIEYTSPLENYKPMTNKITETMYYYLGKVNTDKILKEYDNKYLKYYKQSEYYDKHSDIDMETVKILFNEDYRLMRNRTRLNTGEPIMRDGKRYGLRSWDK